MLHNNVGTMYIQLLKLILDKETDMYIFYKTISWRFLCHRNVTLNFDVRLS